MGQWSAVELGLQIGEWAYEIVARKLYAKRRGRLTKGRDVRVACDFVKVLVKLELCNRQEALEAKKNMDWLHSMSRVK